MFILFPFQRPREGWKQSLALVDSADKLSSKRVQKSSACVDVLLSVKLSSERREDGAPLVHMRSRLEHQHKSLGAVRIHFCALADVTNGWDG